MFVTYVPQSSHLYMPIKRCNEVVGRYSLKISRRIGPNIESIAVK